MKVSIHTVSHIDPRLAIARVRVRVRINYSQASRVYQPRMATHMAMSKASRVYSISVFTFHIKVSIYAWLAVARVSRVTVRVRIS